MEVVPLRHEDHYKTDFGNFMTMFKSISAAMFKEWEFSKRLQSNIEEERKSG